MELPVQWNEALGAALRPLGSTLRARPAAALMPDRLTFPWWKRARFFRTSAALDASLRATRNCFATTYSSVCPSS